MKFYKVRKFIKDTKFKINNPVFKREINNSGFYRIYNIHIRKCGETSLNRAFSAYPDKNDENHIQLASVKDNRMIINELPVVGWNQKHIKRGDYWYAFSHSPYDEIFPLKRKTYTFTFLRDPIERVVSHYNMLMDMKTSKSNHPAFKLEKNWLGESFDEFIINIPPEHLQNQLYMFSKEFNVDKAIENISNVNFVGLLGRDEEKFLDIIKKKFNINLNYEHYFKTSYGFLPNAEQTEILNEYLKKEILFFNKVFKFNVS